MNKKAILIIIVVLNSIVLLGQLWPEGAPPFARTFNIVTLIVNLILLFDLVRKRKKEN
jgi:hypothetical protein